MKNKVGLLLIGLFAFSIIIIGNAEEVKSTSSCNTLGSSTPLAVSRGPSQIQSGFRGVETRCNAQVAKEEGAAFLACSNLCSGGYECESEFTGSPGTCTVTETQMWVPIPGPKNSGSIGRIVVAGKRVTGYIASAAGTLNCQCKDKNPA